jgi:hypothetical protein
MSPNGSFQKRKALHSETINVSDHVANVRFGRSALIHSRRQRMPIARQGSFVAAYAATSTTDIGYLAAKER